MADVFISYSKAYRGLTESLAHDLVNNGYTVWWDSSIVPGDRFRDIITLEISRARAAIVIWTGTSVKSDWVYSEASRARSRRILITVRHTDVTLDDIPPPFDSFHAEPLSNRSAIYAALRKLGVQPSGRAALPAREDARTDRVDTTSKTVPDTPAFEAPRGIQAEIRRYLLGHPEILQECMALLEERDILATARRATAAIQRNAQLIFDSPHQAVIGNRHGDTNLVEFFDYNCGYSRRALADIIELLKKESSLRIVLKEFPVLGPGSVEAAQISVAARMLDAHGDKYFEFHKRLLEHSGQVGRVQALATARDVGFDPATIESSLADAEITLTLQENMKLAEELGLNGTPSYVVGTEPIIGAVGFPALSNKIGVARAAKSGLVRVANGSGEEITLAARTIACKEGEATWQSGFEELTDAFKAVHAFLKSKQIVATGPPLAIYTATSEDGFRFKAGFPVSEPADHPGDGAIDFETTPEGPAIWFIHRGPYDSLDSAYNEATSRLDERHLEARSMFIEEFVNDPLSTPQDDLIIYVHVPIDSHRATERTAVAGPNVAAAGHSG